MLKTTLATAIILGSTTASSTIAKAPFAANLQVVDQNIKTILNNLSNKNAAHLFDTLNFSFGESSFINDTYPKGDFMETIPKGSTTKASTLAPHFDKRSVHKLYQTLEHLNTNGAKDTVINFSSILNRKIKES